MKIVQVFIFTAILLASNFNISAQLRAPRISWKGMQANYSRFGDIQPVIVNESSYPIYFDCTLEHFDRQKMYSYVEKSDNTRLLIFDEKSNAWDWNVGACGTVSKEERKTLKKEYAIIKTLQKQGKYQPTGCRINPQEEFAINFDEKQWLNLINGSGMVEPYRFGKFKFEVKFWWYNNQKDSGQNTSESPVFTVSDKVSQ